MGTSVIDYILLNYESFHLVEHFKVLVFNDFSDHAPLQFSLCASSKFKENREHFTNSSYKFIWNDEQEICFIGKLFLGSQMLITFLIT